MFRPLSKRALFSLTSLRHFHSPYVALRDAPLPKSLASSAASAMNEKQDDHSAEPILTHAGTRAYVVSEPDASSKHYQVPSGAFPASVPYVSSAPIEPSSDTGEGSATESKS
ncbi:hypothetical protein APHAL10511_003494 [Amanita phalloides]|nr:hypothetical protein APHAL10511_003494 [Amanita phalloides]